MPRSTAHPLSIAMFAGLLLATTSLALAGPTASRSAPYPDYEVGDTATLTITTNPAQPNQPVYRWRYLNGSPDGVQGLEIGTTNASGVFTVSVVLPASAVGEYSYERFSVGSTSSAKTSYLHYSVDAASAPSASWSWPHPSYDVGDNAQMNLTTSPAQPNQPVYRWRMKNGQPDGPQPTQVGTTDANGSLTIAGILSTNEVGDYSGVRFAVGTPSGPRSFAQSYHVVADDPPIAQRPGLVSSYGVGDTAVLEIDTWPSQRYQPVYRWRNKDGSPDGAQPTRIGTTDHAGELTISVPLGTSALGSYTGEQYSVGSSYGPRSAPRSYEVLAPPATQRTDANFPRYELGDTATLRLTTDPAQPNQPVYTWRLKDGVVERDGLLLGTTDAQGVFVNSLTIDQDETLCGDYSDERFAVGDPANPRSTPLAYSVCTGEPTLTILEPDGVADTADTSFAIRWEDEDPDDDASIDLYYGQGHLIVAGLSEDADGTGDRYIWNVSGLAEGTYAVYAIIDDGDNPPVRADAPGPIVIDHDAYNRQAVDKANQQIQTLWTDRVIPEVLARAEQAIQDLSCTVADEPCIDEVYHLSIQFDAAPGFGSLTDEQVVIQAPLNGSWSVLVDVKAQLFCTPFGCDHSRAVLAVNNLSAQLDAAIDASNPARPVMAAVEPFDLVYDVHIAADGVLGILLDLYDLLVEEVDEMIEEMVDEAIEEVDLTLAGTVGGPELYGTGGPAISDSGEATDFLGAALAIDGKIQDYHFRPAGPGPATILGLEFADEYVGTWAESIAAGFDPGTPIREDDYADSSIWSGTYLAAQAYRAAATGDVEAVQNAQRVLDGIEMLLDMRGTPGLLNRAIVPISGYLPTETLLTMPEYSSMPEPYAAQYQGQWYVMTDKMTRDQYQGVFLGLTMAYHLVPDTIPGGPALRAQAKANLEKVLDYVLSVDWAVPRVSSYWRDEKGPVSVAWMTFYDQMLAWLRAGMMVNPTKYAAAWEDHRRLADLAWFSPWLNTFDPAVDSYYKFNLEHGALLTFLTLEDPATEEWQKVRRSLDILRAAIGHHNNAYFDLVEIAADQSYAAKFGAGFALSGGVVDLPGRIREQQRRWLDLPRRRKQVLADDIEVEVYTAPTEVPTLVSRYPLPMGQRRPTDYFQWQRTPFDLGANMDEEVRRTFCILTYCSTVLDEIVQSGTDWTVGDVRFAYRVYFNNDEIPLDGDFVEESPGIDFLLSYWMGRYYGVFADPAADDGGRGGSGGGSGLPSKP